MSATELERAVTEVLIDEESLQRRITERRVARHQRGVQRFEQSDLPKRRDDHALVTRRGGTLLDLARQALAERVEPACGHGRRRHGVGNGRGLVVHGQIALRAHQHARPTGGLRQHARRRGHAAVEDDEQQIALLDRPTATTNTFGFDLVARQAPTLDIAHVEVRPIP